MSNQAIAGSGTNKNYYLGGRAPIEKGGWGARY